MDVQDEHAQTQADLSIGSIQITLDLVNYWIVDTRIYKWSKLHAISYHTFSL
jgi:hypothetical protein